MEAKMQKNQERLNESIDYVKNLANQIGNMFRKNDNMKGFMSTYT